MFKQKGFTGSELFIVGWLVLLVLGLGGWIANIVKIINTGFDVFTGLLIARCIGVFIAPLGAVLG
ncbi:hypothetical protein [Delftia tsuruhatensis]|uniref:Uncharacterized protein n=1 Tax=Delftia tsuruhatensis TaxID=180282 RepID=A0ABM6E4U1_9BURK|nr:hypothetical protein [Delftia tsuruhatensis]AOV02423.1 hypothetical protein BI380_14280 [Delftia tsuruhatensis]